MLPGFAQFFEHEQAAPAWTNPYVTDGLVAMWDGEWNAGGGVHDANATVWKDLVGTRDATLSGTYSWVAKSWARDASSSTKCLLPDIPLGQNFMCEYCCVLHNAGDGNFRDFSTTSSIRFELTQNSNNSTSLYYRNVNDSYVARGIGSLGTSRVARTFSFGFDTLGGIYALDGGSVSYDRTVNTPISTSFYNNPTISVGQYYTLSEDADYYNIRIYSRPLTADEIAANYAIDKARFNLP